MTRIVSFADGFTSSSSPDVAGGTQYNFPILNNQTVATPLTDENGDVLVLDLAKTKSAFIKCEISRFDDEDSYLQAIDLKIIHENTGWKLEPGNYIGADVLQLSDIVSDKDLVIILDPDTGEFSYLSGNMAGDNPEGMLKLIITKVLI